MPNALVTGSNRGLGFETARQLIAKGYRVFVTAREIEAAAAAARVLGHGASPLALDVTDQASIARAELSLEPELELDVLVNNAGTALDGFDGDVARTTIETNYRGAVRITDTFAERLGPRANIVMVSSGLGELSAASPELRQRLLAPDLTRRELDERIDDFIARARAANGDLGGWPRNAYRVSKIALNAYTRLLAASLPVGQRVNAVCPGWVRTRMGGTTASRSVEHGAQSIVWAATLGEGGPSGGFFRDGRAISW
jgi:NAD(P)-dependent dehydrogenase (short-subunit alcohol dehydrogenase family)